MKKILCVLAILILTLAMPLTAFADQDTNGGAIYNQGNTNPESDTFKKDIDKGGAIYGSKVYDGAIEPPELPSAIYGVEAPNEPFVPDYDPTYKDGLMTISMDYPEEIYGAGYDPSYQNGMSIYDEYDGDDIETDKSGNIYMGGKDSKISGSTLFGGFGAGYNLTIEQSSFDDCLALAGYRINLNSVYVTSSSFIAGNEITLENALGGGNLFIAGREIKVDDQSDFKSVKIVGQDIDFSGSADEIYIAGDKVTFNGYASGDVKIDANEVVIGKDAIVIGKLELKANEEPDVVLDNFGDYEFEKNEVEEKVSSASILPGFLAGATITHRIFKGFRRFVAAFLLALVIYYLFPRLTKNGKELSEKQTGLVFASGIITIIAAPVAVLILLVTIIGIPVGLILALVFALLKAISIAFTACLLGQIVFKKMKPVLAFLVASAILGFATVIPVLSWIVKLGSYMFTVGTILQLIWQGRKVKEEI